MDNFSDDDDVFLDSVDRIVLEALAAIGVMTRRRGWRSSGGR
jgi:hypothetical protein